MSASVTDQSSVSSFVRTKALDVCLKQKSSSDKSKKPSKMNKRWHSAYQLAVTGNLIEFKRT